jgi:hypothetical protein
MIKVMSKPSMRNQSEIKEKVNAEPWLTHREGGQDWARTREPTEEKCVPQPGQEGKGKQNRKRSKEMGHYRGPWGSSGWIKDTEGKIWEEIGTNNMKSERGNKE